MDGGRCVKEAAGARDGARESARPPRLSFAAGLGVIDLGAGLLVRDARLAVELLHADRNVSWHILYQTSQNLAKDPGQSPESSQHTVRDLCQEASSEASSEAADSYPPAAPTRN